MQITQRKKHLLALDIQTYSHTVIYKVCLTASKTVFGVDAFVMYG